VVVTCRRCAAESPDGFRFCPACGAPLSDAGPPREARKIVTALFCDVTGSTALGEELDPEVLRGVMNRYLREIRETIERHGGTVDQVVGDAVMAVFGIPRLEEDDALRAVRAAAEIRERLPAIADAVGVSLRFRTGVNTGPVLSGEGENLAIGDAVNVAARLEQAAAPGEIVIGQQTFELVRDAVEVEPLEPLALKGKSEPVVAYRLLGVDPVAEGVARRLDAPLVGRERELHLLKEASERVVRERGCHLLTLLGVAGAGKSRLVAELFAELGPEVTVLRGRCLHYGEGITFWPLVEALMPVGERATALLTRLEEGRVATPEELFWEIRRLLESLTSERPLVLHIDDLQWAEAMMLDLLDHVVDLSRGAPILVLCTARPELLEERPGWGGGKLNATTVLLEPLDQGVSEQLLDQLGHDLDPATRKRVIEASEGNPLFLEEMVALARERGEVAVPATIQALLAARLERLASPEREVLERGAVEGEVFHRLAVRSLLGLDGTTMVDRPLAGLIRKELIRPHPAALPDDEAFRFRHLLIRDAAYDGLPKATRAELHERFARWLEKAGAGLPELDEIAGWHFEQAVRYQRELGRAADGAVAEQATGHLLSAGQRAHDRGDGPAARNLLERAYSVAPDGSAVRARIGVDLAEQLLEAGEFDLSDERLREAESHPEVAALAEVARFSWLIRARPRDATATIASRLPSLLEQFHRSGDDLGLARAHMAAFHVHWVGSRATPASEHAALAAEHASRAGKEGMRARALGWYSVSLIFGGTSVASASAELDAIEAQGSGPYLAASLDIVRGELTQLDGRFEDAERLIRRGIEALKGMGLEAIAGACYQVFGRVYEAAGDLERARDTTAHGDQMLSAIGERSFRSTCQAQLAGIEQQLGDRAGALDAIELAEALSAPEDIVNFAITNDVRSRLSLEDGDCTAAVRFARAAVDCAEQTDFYRYRARARMALARALAACGDQPEAAVQARAALDLFRAKGDRPGIALAESLVASL
jgi:class 3 adenylate cyclase/tetratricopeptide (TPR) repeat protein